jgi:hypothetical protein
MAEYKKWEIVEVGGRLTIEQSASEVFEIPSKYFERIGAIQPLSDEIENYTEKEEDLLEKVLEFKGDLTNRRIYKSWQTSAVENLHCITMIQLLLGRQTSVMSVTLRSSDAARFPSDLAFLCRIAKRFNVDLLRIFIGSFHMYIS